MNIRKQTKDKGCLAARQAIAPVLYGWVRARVNILVVGGISVVVVISVNCS